MTLVRESLESDLMRAQAEAAAWIALLHSPERNATIELGLKQWIAADPMHAVIWEKATDIWNETEGLPRKIPRHRERAWRFQKPLFAIAAICFIVATAFVKYYLTSTVTTTIGEQRTLNLDDGSRVELNTNTRLRLKFDRHARTVVLESGEAYFQVAHELRPFIVIAGERRIVALGTAFTVRREEASGGSVTVTLLEGRVAVAPAGAENTSLSTQRSLVTVLKPGQRLRTRPKAAPAVEIASIDKATGWMRGQLIFDHTPLAEAAAEISRYNKTRIVVASEQVAAIPIGGIFRIGDSRSFARAVAETYDLKVTTSGDELVLQSADAEPSSPGGASSLP